MSPVTERDICAVLRSWHTRIVEVLGLFDRRPVDADRIRQRFREIKSGLEEARRALKERDGTGTLTPAEESFLVPAVREALAHAWPPKNARPGPPMRTVLTRAARALDVEAPERRLVRRFCPGGSAVVRGLWKR